MESSFLKNVIKNLNVIIPVFIFLVIMISLIQIKVLKKEPVSSIFHSCLVSGLISL